MGYCSLSCGWMEIRFDISSYITVYVTHKSVCWNVCQENLHFVSQSVFLQTLLLMWTLQLSDGVYCLTEHVFLKVWVKIYNFILLSYQRGFSKSGLAALDICTLSVIFPTHNCRHMTENSDIRPQECSQWQLSFHSRFHLRYQEIFLTHTIRREIANRSWTKGVALGTLVTLQHTLYICHRKQRHKYKNIAFNDNFLVTFHSLSLQADKTCMLWWWLIIWQM
jgi:hypothetical protein